MAYVHTATSYDNAPYENALAKQQALPASPFDRLSMAVDDLRELRKFAEALADRIAGSGLKEVAGESPSLGGGGLIDGLERNTSTILSIVISIRSDLQRIEGRI